MFFGDPKKRLRRKALAARASAAHGQPDAGRTLVERFPDDIWPGLGTVVAGYRPIRDEIDPTPLMETFHCEQCRLALPRVMAPDQPLSFLGYEPGDSLEKDAMGVDSPAISSSRLNPMMILVPLVGFDLQGNRLGYGGGYYDRTLAALRSEGLVLAIGLAFEAQRLKKVPSKAHDQRLDWIITEKEAYRIAG